MKGPSEIHSSIAARAATSCTALSPVPGGTMSGCTEISQGTGVFVSCYCISGLGEASSVSKLIIKYISKQGFLKSAGAQRRATNSR